MGAGGRLGGLGARPARTAMREDRQDRQAGPVYTCRRERGGRGPGPAARREREPASTAGVESRPRLETPTGSGRGPRGGSRPGLRGRGPVPGEGIDPGVIGIAQRAEEPARPVSQVNRGVRGSERRQTGDSGRERQSVAEAGGRAAWPTRVAESGGKAVQSYRLT